MKEYFCQLSKTKFCRHGGNKNYNYGFMSGTAGYCRHVEKWTSDLEECPLLSTDTEKRAKKDKGTTNE